MNRINNMCLPLERYETIKRYGLGKHKLYNLLSLRMIYAPQIRDAIRRPGRNTKI